MKTYTKKVIIISVIFLLLFVLSSIFHGNGSNGGVVAIAILWLMLVVYTLIINFMAFSKSNSLILNTLNVVFSAIMLVLFFAQANKDFGGLASFMPIPSLALIPSIISLFIKTKYP